MFSFNKKGLTIFLLIPLLLFFLSLFPRVYQLDKTEIFPDEITWTVRSREIFLSLKTGYWDNLFRWWDRPDDTEAINLPSALISGASIFFLAKDQPTHYSLELFQDYMAARYAVAVFGAIFIVAYYFAVYKITRSVKIAGISSLLFSLDPTNLALSRWQLADLHLTAWMFLSLFSFFHLKNKKLSIIFSALFGSLAFLTKPTGLVIFPLFIFFSPLKGLLSGVLFIFFTHFIWLGNNGVIGLEIISYVFRQFRQAQEPFLVFFNGKLTNNPPVYYYLYKILFRTPLIILVSFLSIFWIKKSERYKPYVLIFVVLYLAIFSFSTKKLDLRYIFPIYPWVYMIASSQIVRYVERWKSYTRNFAYLFVIGIATMSAVYYFPNYSLYYNVLSGGVRRVQKNNLVSLCMGAKDALQYLEDNFEDFRSVAYMGCTKTVIPYYSPVAISTNWEEAIM